MTKKTELRDWLNTVAKLDMKGHIDHLRAAISAAPEGAYQTPEYKYVMGVIEGRRQGQQTQMAQSSIDDMREAAERDNDNEKRGWCDGLEIAGSWKPETGSE